MRSDDQAYYYERAEAELQMAQRSEQPQVVQAHYTIATHYLERAYSADAVEGGEVAGSDGEKPLLFGSDD